MRARIGGTGLSASPEKALFGTVPGQRNPEPLLPHGCSITICTTRFVSLLLVTPKKNIKIGSGRKEAGEEPTPAPYSGGRTCRKFFSFLFRPGNATVKMPPTRRRETAGSRLAAPHGESHPFPGQPSFWEETYKLHPVILNDVIHEDPNTRPVLQ